MFADALARMVNPHFYRFQRAMKLRRDVRLREVVESEPLQRHAQLDRQRIDRSLQGIQPLPLLQASSGCGRGSISVFTTVPGISPSSVPSSGRGILGGCRRRQRRQLRARFSAMVHSHE